MTAQLSRERLAEIASIYGKTPSLHEAQMMAQAILAGMDSEPLAYFYPGDETEWQGVALAEELDDEQKARCIPLCAAPPPPVVGVDDDVRNIIGLLETNEWAEHCTSTVLGSRLESEITRLVGENKSAPVAVPDEISTTDAMRIMNGRVITMSVHTAYKNGWNACRAARLKAGPVTAVAAPENKLGRAIFEACKYFLLCCEGAGKNYDGIFYDADTELSFSIYELAEKLGIVKCTGNRCWSLLPQVRDEIDAVYRKYALLMLAAAPAAPEQEE